MESADLEVLEDSNIPNKLLHRGQEKKKLDRYIEMSVENNASPSIVIEGEHGTGKTALGKTVLDQSDLLGAYVNCWHARSRHKVLKEIACQLESELALLGTAGSTDEIYRRLQKVISAPKIVVLDEVGKLDNLDPLYDLYELKHVTLVLISNDWSQIIRNDERLNSRFQALGSVSLSSYTTKELLEIVESAASKALPEGCFDDETIFQIAYRSQGDVRKALGLLKQSYIESKVEGKNKVEEDIIADISERLDPDERDLELNKDQKVLLDIVEEEDTIKPGPLYREYRQKVEDPKVERTLRKYLKELAEANKLDLKGQGRWRSYMSKPVEG